MNADGAIEPRVGWVQRSSASTPTMPAPVGGDDRLIVHVECLLRNRRFQFAPQKSPVGMLDFDLRLETPHRSAPRLLGRAQRQRGTAGQFLTGRAILRRLRNADAER